MDCNFTWQHDLIVLCLNPLFYISKCAFKKQIFSHFVLELYMDFLFCFCKGNVTTLSFYHALCLLYMQVTLVKMVNEATANIPNWDITQQDRLYLRLYYTQTLHIFGEGRLKFLVQPLLERLITHISGDYEIDEYNLSAIIFTFMFQMN